MKSLKALRGAAVVSEAINHERDSQHPHDYFTQHLKNYTHVVPQFNRDEATSLSRKINMAPGAMAKAVYHRGSHYTLIRKPGREPLTKENIHAHLGESTMNEMDLANYYRKEFGLPIPGEKPKSPTESKPAEQPKKQASPAPSVKKEETNASSAAINTSTMNEMSKDEMDNRAALARHSVEAKRHLGLAHDALKRGDMNAYHDHLDAHYTHAVERTKIDKTAPHPVAEEANLDETFVCEGAEFVHSHNKHTDSHTYTHPKHGKVTLSHAEHPDGRDVQGDYPTYAVHHNDKPVLKIGYAKAAHRVLKGKFGIHHGFEELSEANESPYDYSSKAHDATGAARAGKSAILHKKAQIAHNNAAAAHEEKIDAHMSSKAPDMDAVQKHQDAANLHDKQAKVHGFMAHRLSGGTNESYVPEARVAKTPVERAAEAKARGDAAAASMAPGSSGCPYCTAMGKLHNILNHIKKESIDLSDTLVTEGLCEAELLEWGTPVNINLKITQAAHKAVVANKHGDKFAQSKALERVRDLKNAEREKYSESTESVEEATIGDGEQSEDDSKQMKRLEQLIRLGLMDAPKLQIVRRAFKKLEKDIVISNPQERAVLLELLGDLITLVTGDDSTYNKIKVSVNHLQK